MNSSDELINQFNTKEKCFKVIGDARSLWGSTSTTHEQFDAIIRTLSFCYLYCPEDLQHMVLATIDEAEIRKSSTLFRNRTRPANNNLRASQ